MISYDLQCANNHTFEGWFEDAEAFDVQEEKGLIACPICNDTSIYKLPSTFSIKSARSAKPSPSSPEELAEFGKKIVAYVRNNFDDVGCNFASEALKIHYGIAEKRNIRGVSTQEEEKVLKEEGVEFVKFPMPSEPDTDA